MDYATLTGITEKRLRECAEEASTKVEAFEYRQCLDMGHGMWQLWLALAGTIDKAAARSDMDRLYALIEPESVSGISRRKPA
ncbi:hypothetical protein [Agrobacterium tumefaciens]|uniref:hypothetical protein n=1 Tax=Agrobacterium tumefaciens TaxID=358 RepID=UPI0015726B71|nr:hypothetical protein [Agrobacterium tumefaciens]NTB05887.1 hypothetical protein [Agrobacterium tumefaciens]